jgi:glycosyltransferase involved in cell wall biosynthesis
MSARSILVVVPRVPWPPRRSGFSVRYFPLLRYLSSRHHVDLVVLGDREAWGGEEGGPLPATSKITYVDVSGRRASLGSRIAAVARGALPGSAPFSMRSVWTPDITRAVAEASRRRKYDIMLWAGPEYLEAALFVARGRPAARCVYDLVDSPSMIATRARSDVGSAAEVNAIRRWENELRNRADLTIYISEADARASQPKDAFARTMTLPNGIYLDDLGDPAQKLALPQGVPPKYVLFFGHMSFGPNVDGAGWLVSEIMPSVRARFPDVKLLIVGHQPAPSVQALASAETIVTGSVDSIWPYVSNAAACVFPLRLAAGLQNKILEALAVGKAVVTTRQCAAGVRAVPGTHLLAADTKEDIIEATLRVLGDASLAQRLGAEGKQLVLREFDWNALTQRFEQALLETPR